MIKDSKDLECESTYRKSWAAKVLVLPVITCNVIVNVETYPGAPLNLPHMVYAALGCIV